MKKPVPKATPAIVALVIVSVVAAAFFWFAKFGEVDFANKYWLSPLGDLPLRPLQTWGKNAFNFAAVGYDDYSGDSRSGQFMLAGVNSRKAYGNLGGFHVVNKGIPEFLNLDPRVFVMRFKDPSSVNADQGGYTLFQGRYDIMAPDYDGLFCNFFQVDQFGNVGIGYLGQQSDEVGEDPSKHPVTKVEVKGSTNYAPFSVSVPTNYTLLTNPVAYAFEPSPKDGELYWTDPHGIRWRLTRAPEGAAPVSADIRIPAASPGAYSTLHFSNGILLNVTTP